MTTYTLTPQADTALKTLYPEPKWEWAVFSTIGPKPMFYLDTGKGKQHCRGFRKSTLENLKETVNSYRSLEGLWETLTYELDLNNLEPNRVWKIYNKS